MPPAEERTLLGERGGLEREGTGATVSKGVTGAARPPSPRMKANSLWYSRLWAQGSADADLCLPRFRLRKPGGIVRRSRGMDDGPSNEKVEGWSLRRPTSDPTRVRGEPLLAQ